MKKYLLITHFFFLHLLVSVQDIEGTPTHIIHAPVYRHGTVSTPSEIDTSLFYNYLDWQLQKDSLPAEYKDGKDFTILIYYKISKEGKLIEVRTPEKDKDELFQYVRRKLLAIPYTWTPATQNGRPVNAYLKLMLIKPGN